MIAGVFADLVIASDVALAVIIGALVGVAYMLVRITTPGKPGDGKHVRHD